ncbi:hypothetical protein R1sor_019417 [Riccia sorocarpa]|uniref:Uncharacterized protein n=1 Tax=Riccia sorocarpa TaxID=122646 RepID=A0ABD3IG36_9MARC
MDEGEMIRHERGKSIKFCPSLKSGGPGTVQPAAKGQVWSQVVASPSRLGQQNHSTPGSARNIVSQKKQESTGEYVPAQRVGNKTAPMPGRFVHDWTGVPYAPQTKKNPDAAESERNREGLKDANGVEQKEAEQKEQGEEQETQFEPMGRRNLTWAEVTEQNIKKLDPFAKFADIPFVDTVDRAEVEEILDGMISNTLAVKNCEEIKDEDIIDVDARFLVSSTRHLQNTSVIVYTMDMKDSYRYVHQWAESVFHQTLGVRIASICSLSRNCFHICLESGTGRNHIFANVPFYMWESMIYVLPWDPRFNPNELKTRGHIAANCPEGKAKQQAEPIPPTKNAGNSKKNKADNGGTTRNENAGRKLPQTRNPKENEMKEGFQVVRKKGWRPYKDPAFRVPATVDNRFGMLQEGDEEAEDERWWDEALQDDDGDVRMDPQDQGDPEDDPNEVPPPPRENGEKQSQGAQGLSGAGTTREGEEVNMAVENEENFTSFAEAEKSNGRSASLVSKDDPLRLSCASGNRLAFTEGRKKVKNQENGEEAEVDSAISAKGPASQSSEQEGSHKTEISMVSGGGRGGGRNGATAKPRATPN